MSDKDDEIQKHFSGKAREGYVEYFDNTLRLIMNNKDLNRSEAFEYLNRIIANALLDEESISRDEKRYKIDLQMSDEDVNKPAPHL